MENIIPQMEAIYSSFTPLEKTIADFFIHNNEKTDLSSKKCVKKLFVSEASLSRFCKKNAVIKGIGSLFFCYKQYESGMNRQQASDNIKLVFNSYQELLNKSYSLIDEAQIERIVKILTEKKENLCIWKRQLRYSWNRDEASVYAHRSKY